MGKTGLRWQGSRFCCVVSWISFASVTLMVFGSAVCVVVAFVFVFAFSFPFLLLLLLLLLLLHPVAAVFAFAVVY